MTEPEPPSADAPPTDCSLSPARLAEELARLARRQDDLDERLGRQAALLEALRQQTDWLVHQAARSVQHLHRQCDDLRQEARRLETERDDLDRRLQEALKQVA